MIPKSISENLSAQRKPLLFLVLDHHRKRQRYAEKDDSSDSISREDEHQHSHPYNLNSDEHILRNEHRGQKGKLRKNKKHEKQRHSQPEQRDDHDHEDGDGDAEEAFYENKISWNADPPHWMGESGSQKDSSCLVMSPQLHSSSHSQASSSTSSSSSGAPPPYVRLCWDETEMGGSPVEPLQSFLRAADKNSLIFRRIKKVPNSQDAKHYSASTPTATATVMRMNRATAAASMNTSMNHQMCNSSPSFLSCTLPLSDSAKEKDRKRRTSRNNKIQYQEEETKKGSGFLNEEKIQREDPHPHGSVKHTMNGVVVKHEDPTVTCTTSHSLFSRRLPLPFPESTPSLHLQKVSCGPSAVVLNCTTADALCTTPSLDEGALSTLDGKDIFVYDEAANQEFAEDELQEGWMELGVSEIPIAAPRGGTQGEKQHHSYDMIQNWENQKKNEKDGEGMAGAKAAGAGSVGASPPPQQQEDQQQEQKKMEGEGERRRHLQREATTKPETATSSSHLRCRKRDRKGQRWRDEVMIYTLHPYPPAMSTGGNPNTEEDHHRHGNDRACRKGKAEGYTDKEDDEEEVGDGVGMPMKKRQKKRRTASERDKKKEDSENRSGPVRPSPPCNVPYSSFSFVSDAIPSGGSPFSSPPPAPSSPSLSNYWEKATEELVDGICQELVTAYYTDPLFQDEEGENVGTGKNHYLEDLYIYPDHRKDDEYDSNAEDFEGNDYPEDEGEDEDENDEYEEEVEGGENRRKTSFSPSSFNDDFYERDSLCIDQEEEDGEEENKDWIEEEGEHFSSCSGPHRGKRDDWERRVTRVYHGHYGGLSSGYRGSTPNYLPGYEDEEIVW